MSMKIEMVINQCYGGFSLSNEAMMMLVHMGHPDAIEKWNDEDEQRWNKDRQGMWYPDIERNDPMLLSVVRALGPAASGECAKLAIVEAHLPDPEDLIDYHDGYESLR